MPRVSSSNSAFRTVVRLTFRMSARRVSDSKTPPRPSVPTWSSRVLNDFLKTASLFIGRQYIGSNGRCASDLRLPPSALQQTQAQRVELDEPRGVALVVGAGIVLEGDVLLAVEALLGLAADHRRIALIELQAHHAFDVLLALVDQGLQHLALRREPEAVIDQLRIARHDLVLQVPRAAIEGDALDAAMRRV